MFAGREREFVGVEIPILLIAERRPASQRPTVEEKLIPFVCRNMQAGGQGLGDFKPTAKSHLRRRRHRKRRLHPLGRPSVDSLAQVVGLSWPCKWVFIQ